MGPRFDPDSAPGEQLTIWIHIRKFPAIFCEKGPLSDLGNTIEGRQSFKSGTKLLNAGRSGVSHSNLGLSIAAPPLHDDMDVEFPFLPLLEKAVAIPAPIDLDSSMNRL
ncbi:hypothetical protein Ancab_005694 [Ancistrocladus abbreviatus]